MDDYKKIVNEMTDLANNLTACEVEKLLEILTRQNKLAIHVEQLEETFPIGDVYDNSSANEQLTILFVGK